MVAHAVTPVDQGELLAAARAGNGAVVRALLGQGADPDTAEGDGATALHWAAYWNDAETVEALLQKGARAEVSNDLGVTPLWLACENGNVRIVGRLLAAGAKADVVLPSGETALMIASRVGVADVVKLLIEHGAALRARVQDRLRANLRVLDEALAGSAVTRLRVEGGLSVVLHLPGLRTESEWVLALLDAGVLTQPGYFYDFAASPRLVLSLLTPEGDFASGIRTLLGEVERAINAA